MPAAEHGQDALRFSLGALADRHQNDVGNVARRRVDHHRQPLDSGRPANGGSRRSAERFDEAVVAAPGDQCALRAEAVGDELEGGVPVIIEPADESRISFEVYTR